MKKAVTTLLIGSFASLAVAGCGTPSAVSLGNPATQSTLGAQDLTSAQMAQAFATQLSAQTRMTPVVQGDQVVVRTANGQRATYDFSQAPQTGMVTFSAGGLSTQFQWQSGQGISAQFLPFIVIAVAVKVVWGGAVAFGEYYFTHRHNFDPKACTIAVVNGMVSESLGAVPVVGGIVSALLAPIAEKWVDGWLNHHIPYKADTVLASGMKLHSEVVAALREAMTQSAQQAALAR